MHISSKHVISLKFQSIADAADFLNVSSSTIYRWIQHDIMPPWALDKIAEHGQLDRHGNVWKNWQIDRTGLLAPDGTKIHIEQLNGIIDWIHSKRRNVTTGAERYMRERYRKHYYKK